MSFLRDAPAELIALVFDNFSLREIILASHVCQSWRLIARTHPVFYGAARLVETRPLTPEQPEVQLFMARIATVCGPVAVILLICTPASVVADLVLPALSTHMHRIKSLRVSLPEDYNIAFRTVLDQPAPVLRRFMLEHYRGAPHASALVIPIGTWALSEPTLSEPTDWVLPYELTEIPALRGVETVRISFPWYYGNVDLETLFTVFPNVRHLDLERVTHTMREFRIGTGRSVLLLQSEPLSARLAAVASSLESLVIEDPSPSSLRALQVANIPVVSLTTTDGYYSDILDEVLRPCSKFRASLMGSFITCTSPGRPGRVYKAVPTPFRTTGPSVDMFFSSLSTLPPLVALSANLDNTGRQFSATLPLPFVEQLHLVLHTRLKRSRDGAPPFFHCDNLSVVVLQSQAKSAYTYRGIADYLECTLTVTDWSAITVVLQNVMTVGAQPPSILPRFVVWEDVADEEEYAWLNDCVQQYVRLGGRAVTH